MQKPLAEPLPWCDGLEEEADASFNGWQEAHVRRGVVTDHVLEPCHASGISSRRDARQGSANLDKGIAR